MIYNNRSENKIINRFMLIYICFCSAQRSIHKKGHGSRVWVYGV